VYLLAIVHTYSSLFPLNIEAILAEVTISRRRKKPEAMVRGNGLGNAYKAILARMKAQKGNQSSHGLSVLMSVLFSRRRLLLDDLCRAQGVDIGSVDLDRNNIPSLKTLLSCCLGLVAESYSSTVLLVRFTLQEHLVGD